MVVMAGLALAGPVIMVRDRLAEDTGATPGAVAVSAADSTVKMAGWPSPRGHLRWPGARRWCSTTTTPPPTRSWPAPAGSIGCARPGQAVQRDRHRGLRLLLQHPPEHDRHDRRDWLTRRPGPAGRPTGRPSSPSRQRRRPRRRGHRLRPGHRRGRRVPGRHRDQRVRATPPAPRPDRGPCPHLARGSGPMQHPPGMWVGVGPHAPIWHVSSGPWAHAPTCAGFGAFAP